MAGFDKVGKETGPGRFEAELTPVGSSVVCSFLVFNYNIDGNVLKPEHKEDLDKHVVPLLLNHRLHAKLTGMASRSGDREYNRNLSLGRVLRVKEYLKSRGIPESKLPGPDIVAAGEDLSTSLSDEDERDRAVRVTIALGIKPLPIWPTIVIPIVITPEGPKPIDLPPVVIEGDASQHWTTRQIFGTNTNVGVGLGVPGVGAGVGVGPVQYHFLLVNRRTHQMSECTFAGPGVSGGVGPNNKSVGAGLSLGTSITMQSHEWNNFETRSGVGFADFEGQAVWMEPGGVGLTTNISAQATLILPDIGARVKVTTGHTVGFPGSALSYGHFSCKAPVQLHLP